MISAALFMTWPAKKFPPVGRRGPVGRRWRKLSHDGKGGLSDIHHAHDGTFCPVQLFSGCDKNKGDCADQEQEKEVDREFKGDRQGVEDSCCTQDEHDIVQDRFRVCGMPQWRSRVQGGMCRPPRS